jgi:hypothetical protein
LFAQSPSFSLGSSVQLLFQPHPAHARSKPYRPACRKPIWPWRAPPGLVGVRRLHSPVSVPYPPRTPAPRPLLSRLLALADRRPSFPVRRAAACRRHGAKLADGWSSIRRHGSTAGANWRRPELREAGMHRLRHFPSPGDSRSAVPAWRLSHRPAKLRPSPKTGASR